MDTHLPYHDRTEAGRMLADRLAAYSDKPDTVVLGLARGGVPVAREVARVLHAPLDVFVVQRFGLPGHPEMVAGVLTSGGGHMLNENVLRTGRVGQAALAKVVAAGAAELRRREEIYRAGRPALALEGRTVLLVDDGIATGATLRSAVRALAAQGPARLVAVAPVGTPEAFRALAGLVDELVCPLRPDPFHSAGSWYAEFPETSDEDVMHCLAEVTMPAGVEDR